ncbi:MAG TPA: class I SAM-dependent methyltransferase [Anaerolineae bacterium]
MKPKPRQLTPENAARFQEPGLVSLYHLRLPYPEGTFEILTGLIADQPRIVLDVGTGTGEIARRLASQVERVDAVDFSAAMIEQGRRLPGGKDVNWIIGRVETVELEPSYTLITAGDSLHWMDWEVVLPRFGRLLSPNGVVAIVTRWELPTPWEASLKALIRRYSTMKAYEKYELAEELERRGLFRKVGEEVTPPHMSYQSVDEYIASFHSRSSLALSAMPTAEAEAFDEALQAAVLPWSNAGSLALETQARVVWGRAL